MIKFLHPSELKEGMEVSACIARYGGPTCLQVSGVIQRGAGGIASLASNDANAEGSGEKCDFAYGWTLGCSPCYYNTATYLVWQGDGDPKKFPITALLLMVETHHPFHSIQSMCSNFIKIGR